MTSKVKNVLATKAPLVQQENTLVNITSFLEKLYHFKVRIPQHISNYSLNCKKLKLQLLKTDCTKTWFAKTDCVRPNTFYNRGGVLCYNKAYSSGDCQITDILQSINMHGGRYEKDSRGIHYKSQRDVPPVDRYDTVRGRAVGKVIGVPKSDHELYTSYIYANSAGNHTDANNCVWWNIPVKRDGLYEISIKAAEFYYKTHGSRTFSVKINDDYVLEELDLLGLANNGVGVDIIINFEVTNHGNVLHLRGFPLKSFHGKLKLEFCFGNCKTESKAWMLGAFYVVRFADNKKHLRGL